MMRDCFFPAVELLNTGRAFGLISQRSSHV